MEVPPAATARFEHIAQFVEGHPQQAHGEDARKHLKLIPPSPRIHDQKAKAAPRGEGLRHEQHRHSRAAGDLERGHGVGQGGGDEHMPQHLQRRPAEGAEGVEIFFVEPLRAGPRDDEDLVARGQGNEQDAGQIPEPEQGQEQGEQHDLGQRIGQKDHRGQRIVHGTDMAQDEPERESHQPCEAHGGEHPPGAGPGMLPECACGERFPEISQHVQRTRQQKFAERQRSDLPDRQQGRQRQQVTEEGTHGSFSYQ